MHLTLSLTRSTAVAPSAHVLRIAAMFGLGLDQARQMCVIPPMTLDLQPRQIVFITGASGGGKTSLLNLIDEALASRDGVRVIRFDRLPMPEDRPLVDCFGALPLERVTTLLSLAGLNDAFVMLRQPRELSDGQRYRFRLALTMAGVESDHAPRTLHVVLADEFGATLDRLTAQIIARNLRKWVTRQPQPLAFIAATTHDDLLEALQPDTLIVKHPGQSIEVLTRPITAAVPSAV